jgi:hypothetical protein
MSESTIRLWAGDDAIDVADGDRVDVTDDIVTTDWGFTADPVHVPAEFRCRHCDTKVVNRDGETWRHADTGNALCEPHRRKQDAA